MLVDQYMQGAMYILDLSIEWHPLCIYQVYSEVNRDVLLWITLTSGMAKKMSVGVGHSKIASISKCQKHWYFPYLVRMPKFIALINHV